MIKAIIFDLDNTLLDFMKMKQFAVKAAITAMNEAGLNIDEDQAYKNIFELYETNGWENQQVFDDFLMQNFGKVSNKILAAGIVSYRRAREATLLVYPNVNKTLIELIKMGIKLAVVSDAPSREAWMRLYYLNLHHVFDPVLTYDDSGARKPSPKPFEMALNILQVNSSEALMIGDWPDRDVVGASQIGMKTVFARYGDTFGTIDSGADWDVNDIYEVVNIIKDLNNE
ncbi:MAG: TIGR02253 family HAD-type hydrolase [Candidatus Marinimicrobia bacterium]|jgi:putative hydrolase of the HAD superfamily|nr:TIGR02253 family HAD-type hydrolase [Candidatus Neomarinimicrobiota bacterium]MBT4150091.1 TIGR02253 family HAD-type hydrolase [Candidatus Neomarinimicrobiota bacterium]MBT4318564.1 TIGR02253 family HAD-type hydrolase [Candidatus Neomarinimicrobiota bacterium]MBT4784253.1 TIGR02253 family HAD-type hydrolase [Candidatus Neomarinimicrobiota bacterium]MBT5097337.1 TIGR02253 family HAD-type hydrolase [Candidatus Neomarinimicrobiota bacterium]|tara:strand:- start:311 stop:994 length:684 start_codon:yes stop_codon:yes gene_type:complete